MTTEPKISDSIASRLRDALTETERLVQNDPLVLPSNNQGDLKNETDKDLGEAARKHYTGCAIYMIA